METLANIVSFVILFLILSIYHSTYMSDFTLSSYSHYLWRITKDNGVTKHCNLPSLEPEGNWWENLVNTTY